MVMARKNKVVKLLVGGVRASLKDKGAEVVSGVGTIVGRAAEGFEIAVGEEMYLEKASHRNGFRVRGSAHSRPAGAYGKRSLVMTNTRASHDRP